MAGGGTATKPKAKARAGGAAGRKAKPAAAARDGTTKASKIDGRADATAIRTEVRSICRLFGVDHNDDAALAAKLELRLATFLDKMRGHAS